MFLYYEGHTFEVNKHATDWRDAVKQAADAGGYLAKITSKGENTAIFDFLKKESKTWSNHYVAPDGGGAEYVWLGGNDLASEGHWRWADGSKLGYTDWGYGGEPDNYQNQDGMAIGLDKWPQPAGGLGHPGEWNDIDVANKLYSLVERDGLYGTDGADTIVGSKLNETFFAGKGSDTLRGLGGNDRIEGGGGKDQLYGGTGADVFAYAARSDSTTITSDTVHDFSQSQHDRIDLSALTNAPMTFIGTNDFSGTGAEVSFQTKSGHSTVFVDSDGNGKADMLIKFDGTINFHGRDFIL